MDWHIFVYFGAQRDSFGVELDLYMCGAQWVSFSIEGGCFPLFCFLCFVPFYCDFCPDWADTRRFEDITKSYMGPELPLQASQVLELKRRTGSEFGKKTKIKFNL